MCETFDPAKLKDDLEEARSLLRELGLDDVIALGLDFSDPDAAEPEITIRITCQIGDLSTRRQLQVFIEANQVANMLTAKGWNVLA